MEANNRTETLEKFSCTACYPQPPLQ